MAVNPLRKILWKIGLDLHRFRPEFDHLLWLEKAGIKTVLDIGANTGQFASEIRVTLPEAFIYSFEPLKDCFETLLQSRKGDKKFQAFNFALGESNGDVMMHRSVYSPSSSILKMGHLHKYLFPHTKGEITEKITVRRLDDLTEMNPISLEKDILVKIDTQGYEDKVIRGGLKFLKQAEILLVETAFVSLYESQPLFADIHTLLISQGFVYKGGLFRKFNAKDGGVLTEDSLFTR